MLQLSLSRFQTAETSTPMLSFIEIHTADITTFTQTATEFLQYTWKRVELIELIKKFTDCDFQLWLTHWRHNVLDRSNKTCSKIIFKLYDCHNC